MVSKYLQRFSKDAGYSCINKQLIVSRLDLFRCTEAPGPESAVMDQLVFE